MELTLDALRDRLAAWKGCPLAERANPVFGHGNPRAAIMFIGEAPGQKEDEQGKPFVGAAGKLLDEMLKSIDMSRDDVYISNVVKYRPPDNRDPTPEEKEACVPWLMLEIAIIKPRVIITLGRHALTQFFSSLSIGDAHGKPQKLSDTCTAFPMYHPAAALHNPGLRETLFADMQSLKAHLASQSV